MSLFSFYLERAGFAGEALDLARVPGLEFATPTHVISAERQECP